MAIDPTTISLTDEQRRALAEVSEYAGKSWEEVLFEALQDFRARVVAPAVSNGGSLGASLRSHGLLGCIKGGPADMSTNPRYMEGFGENGDDSTSC